MTGPRSSEDKGFLTGDVKRLCQQERGADAVVAVCVIEDCEQDAIHRSSVGELAAIPAVASVGRIERGHAIEMLIDRPRHLALKDRRQRRPAKPPAALAPP